MSVTFYYFHGTLIIRTQYQYGTVLALRSDLDGSARTAVHSLRHKHSLRWI